MSFDVPQSVRILVVDDVEIWREQVCSIVEKQPDWQVVSEASDGLEAVHKARELKPDLILLDIGLPNLNGIEVAHRVCKTVPNTKVLFVTQEDDAEVVLGALNNGAKGYVLKSDVGRELLPAIKAVLRGEACVSSRISHKVSSAGEGDLFSPPQASQITQLRLHQPNRDNPCQRGSSVQHQGFCTG